MLKRAGLRAVSGHDGPDHDLANTSWQDSSRRRSSTPPSWARSSPASRGSRAAAGVEKFEGLAERFNEAGELAKDYGLKFFYHNHDFEFTTKQADGSPVYDLLLERTDPRSS